MPAALHPPTLRMAPRTDAALRRLSEALATRLELAAELGEAAGMAAARRSLEGLDLPGPQRERLLSLVTGTLDTSDWQTGGWEPELGGNGPPQVRGVVLAERLGRGGMGSVWAGRLAASSDRGALPVAVKTVHPELLARPDLRAQLHREVELVAQLDHPAIAAIYDVVPAVHADGRAAPAIVMERADGVLGTVDSWGALHDVLVQLLTALGHAHAHGIVHLDVKPDNVLRFDDVVTSWRLGDFGIAHLGQGDGVVRGTPAYMAPEQWLGEGLGPWTDLYAVGVMAYELATGERFVSPTFHPRFPVPDGFEGWLGWLMSMHPDERPRRAADARAALQGLQGDPPARGLPATVPLSLPSRLLPPAAVGFGAASLRRGLLVGRKEERTALWAHLVAVHETGVPRAVVLHGPEGSGRSRLARWLSVAAHETGAVEVVRLTGGTRALVDDSDGADRGRDRLGRLSQHLSDHDTGRTLVLVLDDVPAGDEWWDWVADPHRALPEGLAVLVLVVASAAPADDGAAVGLAVVPLPLDDLAHVLRSRARLDDELALRLAAEADGGPGRAVAMVQRLVDDDALVWTDAGYQLREGYGPLVDAPRSVDEAPAEVRRALQLGALLADGAGEVDATSWRAACAAADVLGAADAALAWASRTGWARRTPRGWRWRRSGWQGLRPSVDASLAVHALPHVGDDVAARVDVLVAAGRRAEALDLLRDRLGMQWWPSRADGWAWLRRWEALAGDPSHPSVAVLSATTRAWLRFDAGDRAWALQAADDALALARASGEHLVVALRTAARARYGAGRSTGALPYLEEAVERSSLDTAIGRANRRSLGSLLSVLGLADRGEAVVAPLQHVPGLSAGERAWNDYSLGWAYSMQGRTEEALALIRRARDADDGRSYTFTAQVWLGLGIVEDRMGWPERAEASVRMATEVLWRSGDDRRHADAQNDLGEMLRRQGRLDEAEAAYRRCLALFRRVGAEPHPMLDGNLGLVCLARGRRAEAEVLLQRSLDGAVALKHPGFVGIAAALLLPAIVDQPARCAAVAHQALEALRSSGFADPDALRCARQAAQQATGPLAALLWEVVAEHAERIGDTAALAEARPPEEPP